LSFKTTTSTCTKRVPTRKVGCIGAPVCAMANPARHDSESHFDMGETSIFLIRLILLQISISDPGRRRLIMLSCPGAKNPGTKRTQQPTETQEMSLLKDASLRGSGYDEVAKRRPIQGLARGGASAEHEEGRKWWKEGERSFWKLGSV
jgi:hypothetical protein